MKASFFLLAGGLMCVSAYAGNPTPSANLHELMKNIVAPQTQVVWDIGNQALDDQGNPDASKLKPADWAKIAAAAGKVKQASQTLVQADKLMAAGPGQKIEGEGSPDAFGAKEVQKVVDAQPKVFRAFAQQLAASMDEVITSAQTKNAAKLADVSGRLDQVCEACHVQFWYPNQPAPK
jgi:cytochrome c556